MPIIEPAIRPPAERESFLLQVTLGCSSNNCSFCGAYLGKPFRAKKAEEIFSDISLEALARPLTRRVFLMDGDALALNNSKIMPILNKLQGAFPMLARVASYANGYNITGRSSRELEELSGNKLKLIYIGLESGSPKLLQMHGKKSSVTDCVDAVRLAESAGIKSSVMVLIGFGGKKFSEMHIEATVKALNIMQPRYLSFLTLMVLPGTALFERCLKGGFEELDAYGQLAEAKKIIAGLELKKTVFRSDHASNFLSLEGRFPYDKSRLLKMYDSALAEV